MNRPLILVKWVIAATGLLFSATLWLFLRYPDAIKGVLLVVQVGLLAVQVMLHDRLVLRKATE
jgi:hypothetical protein